MKKILPNGTQVLVFYDSKGGRHQNLDESEFIRGVIVDSTESDNLSHHGSALYEQIYTVIGENGKNIM